MSERHPNADLIERFYTALGARDGGAMAACYAPTGRPVINDIRASFRFAGGLIVEHRDRFDWSLWARQALGPTGRLLGWNPLFHNAARNKARETLAEFRARQPG